MSFNVPFTVPPLRKNPPCTLIRVALITPEFIQAAWLLLPLTAILCTAVSVPAFSSNAQLLFVRLRRITLPVARATAPGVDVADGVVVGEAVDVGVAVGRGVKVEVLVADGVLLGRGVGVAVVVAV